eukprot:829968-Pyramimonas_sp.AAC.1
MGEVPSISIAEKAAPDARENDTKVIGRPRSAGTSLTSYIQRKAHASPDSLHSIRSQSIMRRNNSAPNDGDLLKAGPKQGRAG